MELECPNCRAKLRISDSMAGRTGRCSKCGAGIAIPAAPFESVPSVPAPPTSKMQARGVLPAQGEQGAGGGKACSSAMAGPGQTEYSPDAPVGQRYRPGSVLALSLALTIAAGALFRICTFAVSQCWLRSIITDRGANYKTLEQQRETLRLVDVSVLGVLSLVTAALFVCWLCRAWASVPEIHRSFTPAKAVGLLFVPFYNFYWVFVCFVGLSQSLRKALIARSPTKDPGPQAEYLAFAYGCVLIVTLLWHYFWIFMTSWVHQLPLVTAWKMYAFTIQFLPAEILVIMWILTANSVRSRMWVHREETLECVPNLQDRKNGWNVK